MVTTSNERVATTRRHNWWPQQIATKGLPQVPRRVATMGGNVIHSLMDKTFRNNKKKHLKAIGKQWCISLARFSPTNRCLEIFGSSLSSTLLAWWMWSLARPTINPYLHLCSYTGVLLMRACGFTSSPSANSHNKKMASQSALNARSQYYGMTDVCVRSSSLAYG